MDKTRRVFLVHGRNRSLAQKLSKILERLGMVPMDFSDVRRTETFRGRFVGEVLDHAFELAQAIVIIVNGEEQSRLRARFLLPEDRVHSAELQPRPNVLIEMGMALRSHPHRVVIVEVPPLRTISDIAGMVTLRLDEGSTNFVTELSARLKQAGCIVSDDPPNERLRISGLNEWQPGTLKRFATTRVLPLAAILTGITVASASVIVSNWCGRDCRAMNETVDVTSKKLTEALNQANEMLNKNPTGAQTWYGSGMGLWVQARDNKKHNDATRLELYRVALDQYRKAYDGNPGNIEYLAAVAASLNANGFHQQVLDEIVPLTNTAVFQAGSADEKAWTFGEIAVAFLMLGDRAAAEAYEDRASAIATRFRGWPEQEANRWDVVTNARRSLEHSGRD